MQSLWVLALEVVFSLALLLSLVFFLFVLWSLFALLFFCVSYAVKQVAQWISDTLEFPENLYWNVDPEKVSVFQNTFF